jgi:1-phosphofructokinase family hexose kinase
VILAAGLSPAWQRIMVFDDLQPGEVNRAREVVNCASGKVLNVAIGLKHLGMSVHCLSSCGGEPAALMKREFETLEIPTTWIETSAPTRTCTTVIDRGTSQITELVENTELIGADELNLWKDSFRSLARQDDLLVLSGSLPVGVPSTLFADLLSASDVPAILDVRREELLAALPHQPRVIKPNREELEQTVGRPLPERQDVLTAADELRQAGAEWVVISDGAQPLTVVGPEERFSVAVCSVEQVVNPIGCGDSLTAGIAAAIHEDRPMTEAIRWGVACSAQNLQSLLPARLDYDRMLATVDSLKLERIV